MASATPKNNCELSINSKQDKYQSPKKSKLRRTYFPNKKFNPSNASSKLEEGYKSLRVINRSLIFVSGLPNDLLQVETQTLKSFTYFGKYGNVLNISIYNGNKNKSIDKKNSCILYVTYTDELEAELAICDLNERLYKDNLLRANYGTTKYCNFFLKGEICYNKNCYFLHDTQGTEQSLTSKDSQNLRSSPRLPGYNCFSHSLVELGKYRNNSCFGVNYINLAVYYINENISDDHMLPVFKKITEKLRAKLFCNKRPYLTNLTLLKQIVKLPHICNSNKLNIELNQYNKDVSSSYKNFNQHNKNAKPVTQRFSTPKLINNVNSSKLNDEVSDSEQSTTHKSSWNTHDNIQNLHPCIRPQFNPCSYKSLYTKAFRCLSNSGPDVIVFSPMQQPVASNLIKNYCVTPCDLLATSNTDHTRQPNILLS